ncbi:MAG: GFA family protein [Halioglobus sp.]|nr:GFA family protein [Halioglobus sp.]
MQITGGCFCGELRYEADITDALIGVCHCRDCQILSGSAFRTSCAVSPGNFKVTKGKPSHFDKTGDSGKVRRMLFCGNCGTHLCSMPLEEEEDSFVSIRVASADQFSELRPMAEIFCQSKVGWLPEIGDTFQFPRMPGED